MDIKRIMLIAFDWLQNLIIGGFVVAVLWYGLRLTTVATFRIPTDSMEPAIMAGDQVIVNKWILGGRLLHLWKDIPEDKEVKVSRLPGIRAVRHNDILVFNFPYPEAWDSLGFSTSKYYVKRCVALPGDTLSIVDAHYKVAGLDLPLGNVESQDHLETLVNSGTAGSMGIVMDAWPHADEPDWTIMNFGPLYIPEAGKTISLDSITCGLYRNLIEWETGLNLSVNGDSVFLGDSLVNLYTFRNNCYFLAGDNVINSQDSRYWGLLPEQFIHGVAVRIGKSSDPYDGRIRWRRVLRKINF